MRPRVFPAEDLGSGSTPLNIRFGGFNEAAGIPRGRQTVRQPARDQQHSASMRPRVFPAEDIDLMRGFSLGFSASMRPRVFPAEDRL